MPDLSIPAESSLNPRQRAQADRYGKLASRIFSEDAQLQKTMRDKVHHNRKHATLGRLADAMAAHDQVEIHLLNSMRPAHGNHSQNRTPAVGQVALVNLTEKQAARALAVEGAVDTACQSPDGSWHLLLNPAEDSHANNGGKGILSKLHRYAPWDLIDSVLQIKKGLK